MVNRPAEWLAHRERDPLVNHLWKVIESFQSPQLWKRASQHLGLSNQQLLELYFGQVVSVADLEVGDRHAAIVMSRADSKDLAQLPEALGLSPLGRHGRIGPFRTYKATEKGKEYVIGLGKRWLFITEAPYLEHMRRLWASVAGGSRPLKESERYVELMRELPDQADAVVFTNDPEHKEHHAMVIRRQGQSLTADYIAKAQRIDELLKDVEQVGGYDFGPLPRSVISAATMNVMQRAMPGDGAFNLLLFPRNFRQHVRPWIGPPVIAFLAALEPQRVEPNPGVPVPVFGMAVKINNPAVVADLDRIVKGVHFLLSASRLDLGQGLFGVRRVSQGGMEYQVAEFGPIIQKLAGKGDFARMAKLPSSAGLTKLTFGRVGPYYLVCSQEAFFHDWYLASSDPSLRLVSTPGFGDFAFEEKPRPVASALVRAPELGRLLAAVADYWKKAKEQGMEDPGEPEKPKKVQGKTDQPKAEENKESPDPFERPIRWVADGLQHRHSFAVQLWADERQRLRGQLRIQPGDQESDH